MTPVVVAIGRRGRPPKNAPKPTHKLCPRCEHVKQVEDFGIRRRAGNVLLQSYCKDCAVIRAREFARKNSEKIRQQRRQRRKTDHQFALSERSYAASWRRRNPERVNETRRRYEARNVERLREKRRRSYHANKERESEKYREWRLRNPHKNAAKASAYYARKIRAIPAWADMRKIEEIYARCAELNAADGGNRQVDHIVPLCSPLVCGLHVEYNLQIIEASQNQSKSNRFWPDMP